MHDEAYRELARHEETHWWYRGLDDLVVALAGRYRRRGGAPLDILDAGCGCGRLCGRLAGLGRVRGCDIHPLALDMGTAAGHELFRCDLARDDLGSERYDLITCLDVLYHQWITDERFVLEGFCRALRPGGILIVQVPAFEALRGSHDLTVMGQRRYRRDQLIGLLEQSGFSIRLASYRLLLPFLPILLFRSLSRIGTAAGKGRSDLGNVPEPLNRLLTGYTGWENRRILAGRPVPFGTSLLAVAQRPERQG